MADEAQRGGKSGEVLEKIKDVILVADKEGLDDADKDEVYSIFKLATESLGLTYEDLVSQVTHLSASNETEN